MLRPVTHSDPAHFQAGRQLRDGSDNPDYGCVFWEAGPLGRTIYYFNRTATNWVCWTEGPPAETLVVQGRVFIVAGRVGAAGNT